MLEPVPEHPTASLLEAAQGGDGEAFDQLFARVTPRLRWYVGIRLGARLRSRLEPDDVLQETYTAAWSSLSGFEDRGPGSFLRWLFVLAENQVRRLAQHHGAQQRDAGRAQGPADGALALAADPHSGPCTRAVRVEGRMRVAAALGRLPDDEREALLARLVEGRTLASVAERLGRSETATRRLVARATEHLGRLLGEEVRRG